MQCPVEFACLCIIRVIDSHCWASPENLKVLIDMELLVAVNVLSLPAGGSPFIAANTFVQLLRALATSVHASLKILIVLLEAASSTSIPDVLPFSQSESEEQGNAPSCHRLAGWLADVSDAEPHPLTQGSGRGSSEPL